MVVVEWKIRDYEDPVDEQEAYKLPSFNAEKEKQTTDYDDDNEAESVSESDKEAVNEYESVSESDDSQDSSII
ncbi:hypothetical protein Tco_1342526 [Tanacetum coccineum]